MKTPNSKLLLLISILVISATAAAAMAETAETAKPVATPAVAKVAKPKAKTSKVKSPAKKSARVTPSERKRLETVAASRNQSILRFFEQQRNVIEVENRDLARLMKSTDWDTCSQGQSPAVCDHVFNQVSAITDQTTTDMAELQKGLVTSITGMESDIAKLKSPGFERLQTKVEKVTSVFEVQFDEVGKVKKEWLQNLSALLTKCEQARGSGASCSQLLGDFQSQYALYTKNSTDVLNSSVDKVRTITQ